VRRSGSPSLSKAGRVSPAHFLCSQPWQLPSQNTASSPVQCSLGSRIGSSQMRQSVSLLLPPFAFLFGGDVPCNFLLSLRVVDVIVLSKKKAFSIWRSLKVWNLEEDFHTLIYIVYIFKCYCIIIA